MPVTESMRGHRWRWGVLVVATAVAIVGFWAAGSTESRYSGVGVAALPFYVAAAYLTAWWAVPFPPMALVVGYALSAHAESNDNEYAWINYFFGLLFCEAAIVCGALLRRQAQRKAQRLRRPE